MKNLIIMLLFACGIFTTSCNKQAPGVKDAGTLVQEVNPSVMMIEDGCEGGDDEDPQPMLSGRVYDFNTNISIGHACVSVYTVPGGTLIGTTGSDGSGHYYFNSLANGNYNLVVSATGYTTGNFPFNVSGSPQTLNADLQ